MQRTDTAFAAENRVVWTLWLTYGVFYFCRTNISAAVPGLKAPLEKDGVGLAADEVGWILASLKIAYGLGQVVNGQLAERISPRVLLAIGMFGSALLNVLFGLGAGFYFLLFVWASNGFCQSLGWTPCVRVMANWVPISRRGRAVGIIGTGYQVTLGLTYLLAGQSAEYLGWRGALYVPAVLLALTGVFMLICLREAPQKAEEAARKAELENGRMAAKENGSSPSLPDSQSPTLCVSLSECLYWTLYNPTLWPLGLALGLLNACRYGFLDWGVTHLMDTQQIGVGKAVLQFFVIAIGATAGSYLAGWATDRFFGGRRAPAVCLLMLLLGVLSLVYDAVVQAGPAGTMALLIVVGFCIYGPQVLLVGTAPADLAHKGTSAAAAGFVNFLGYMGAASGDVITGYYAGTGSAGWQTAIHIWAGWAFAGAALTALLWNTTSRKVGLLPAIVPRLGGILCLAGGSAAVAVVDQPVLLWIASVAGVLCLAATIFARRFALGALVFGAAGVLVVFASLILPSTMVQERLIAQVLTAQGLIMPASASPGIAESAIALRVAMEPAGVAWQQAAGLLGYGLSLIAAVMILVERKVQVCESSSSEPGAARA